jgi:hypothetical protein
MVPRRCLAVRRWRFGAGVGRLPRALKIIPSEQVEWINAVLVAADDEV